MAKKKYYTKNNNSHILSFLIQVFSLPVNKIKIKLLYL